MDVYLLAIVVALSVFANVLTTDGGTDACECGKGAISDGRSTDGCGDWYGLKGFGWCYLKGKPKENSLSSDCVTKTDPTWSTRTNQYWSRKLCNRSYLASVHCGSKQVSLSGKLMRMCRRCAEKATDPNISCALMREKTRKKCKRFHPNFCAITTTKTETTLVKTTDRAVDNRIAITNRAVDNRIAITSYVGNYCDDEGYSGVRLKLCKTCYQVIIQDGCATLTDEFILGCRKADASFCPFQKPTLPTTKVGRITRRHRKDGVLEPLRTAVIVISVAVVLLSVAVITVAVVCRRRRRFTDRETLV